LRAVAAGTSSKRASQEPKKKEIKKNAIQAATGFTKSYAVLELTEPANQASASTNKTLHLLTKPAN
jgi:hypothetical protein